MNPFEHVYLTDIEHREEGGTPAIVESIRAGLVFQLKAAVGVEAIREREHDFITPRDAPLVAPIPRSRSSAATTPTGCRSCRSSSATTAGTCTTTSSSRCSTTCSASSRAAAARAPGPYGHRLLGIDIETSHEFEREITRGCEGIKPGWVRVNFNYFISEAVFAFLLDAVDLVATDGWRLLPDYAFEPATGPVAPPGGPARAAARACATSATTTGAWTGRRTGTTSRSRGSPAISTRPGRSSRARSSRRRRPSVDADEVGPDFEALRWFWLPEEVAAAADRARG